MQQRRGAPRPMGQNNSQKKDSNKSINAVEVKSYLNAWSTKQKLKVRLFRKVIRFIFLDSADLRICSRRNYSPEQGQQSFLPSVLFRKFRNEQYEPEFRIQQNRKLLIQHLQVKSPINSHLQFHKKMAERSEVKSGKRSFASKNLKFKFLTRGFASRFQLRFALQFFAKLK